MHNSPRERIRARACARARECAWELRVEDRRVRATRSVASIRACHSNRYQRILRRAGSSYFIAMNGRCSPHEGVLSTSCNPIRHAALSVNKIIHHRVASRAAAQNAALCNAAFKRIAPIFIELLSSLPAKCSLTFRLLSRKIDRSFG